jgi:hypothetical protein
VRTGACFGGDATGVFLAGLASTDELPSKHSEPSSERLEIVLISRGVRGMARLVLCRDDAVRKAREQVTAHLLSNAQTVLRALHDHQTQVNSGIRTRAGDCL